MALNIVRNLGDNLGRNLDKIAQLEAIPRRQRTRQQEALLHSLRRGSAQGSVKAKLSPSHTTEVLLDPSQPDLGSYRLSELYPSQIGNTGEVGSGVMRPEMLWGSADDFSRNYPEIAPGVLAKNPGALNSAKYNMPYYKGVDVSEGNTKYDFTLPGLAGHRAADAVDNLINSGEIRGPQAIAVGYEALGDVPASLQRQVRDEVGTLGDIYSNIANKQQYPVTPQDSSIAWERPNKETYYAQDVPNYLLSEGIDGSIVSETGNQGLITGAKGTELVDSSEIRGLVAADNGAHVLNSSQLGYGESIYDNRMPWDRPYEVENQGQVFRYDPDVPQGQEFITGYTPRFFRDGQREQAERLADIHSQRLQRDSRLANNASVARQAIKMDAEPRYSNDLLTGTWVEPLPREMEYGLTGTSWQSQYINPDIVDTSEARAVPGLFIQQQGSGVRPVEQPEGRFGITAPAYIETRGDLYSPFTEWYPQWKGKRGTTAYMSFDPPVPDEVVMDTSNYSGMFQGKFNPRSANSLGTFNGDVLREGRTALDRKVAIETGKLTRMLDQVVPTSDYARSIEDRYADFQNLLGRRATESVQGMDSPNPYREQQYADLQAMGSELFRQKQRIDGLINSRIELESNIGRAFDELGDVSSTVVAKTRLPNGQVQTELLDVGEVMRRNQETPVRQMLNLPHESASAFIKPGGQIMSDQGPIKLPEGYRVVGSPDSTSILTKHMDDDPTVLSGPNDSASVEPVFRLLNEDPRIATDPIYAPKHNQVRKGVQFVLNEKGKPVQILSYGEPVETSKGVTTWQPWDHIATGPLDSKVNRYKVQKVEPGQKLRAELADRRQARDEGYMVPRYASAPVNLPDSKKLDDLNSLRAQHGEPPLSPIDIQGIGGVDRARAQFAQQLQNLRRVNAEYVANKMPPAATLQDVRRLMAQNSAAQAKLTPQTAAQLQATAQEVLQAPTVYRQPQVTREEVLGSIQETGIDPRDARVSTAGSIRTDNSLTPNAPMLIKRGTKYQAVPPMLPDSGRIVYNQPQGATATPGQIDFEAQARTAAARDEANYRNARADQSLVRDMFGETNPWGSKRLAEQPNDPEVAAMSRFNPPAQGSAYPELEGTGQYFVNRLPSGADYVPAQGTQARRDVLQQGKVDYIKQLQGSPSFRAHRKQQLNSELSALRESYMQAQQSGNAQALAQIRDRGIKAKAELDYIAQMGG